MILIARRGARLRPTGRNQGVRNGDESDSRASDADRQLPVSPGEEELLIAANAALADPNFRASVRQMHAEGYPLVQMVGALGLDDDMSDRVRRILESMSDDEVAGIRAAVLNMLDGKNFTMPVVCTVAASDLDKPVAVQVSPDAGTPTIHVRSA